MSMDANQSLAQVRSALEEEAAGRVEGRPDMPEYDSYYEDLFKMIAKGHGRQLEGWQYCLSEGELLLLADSIYRYDLPAEPLIKVFAGVDKFQYIEKIYRGWQDKGWQPDGAGRQTGIAGNQEQYRGRGDVAGNRAAEVLFVIITADNSLHEMFKEKYRVSPVDILDNIRNNTLIQFMGEQAGLYCDGTYTGFAGALAGFGLSEEGALYKACMKRFMLVCNGKAYMEMGCDKTHAFFDELELSDRKAMTHNMLKVMDEFQLRTFVSFAPIFRELIGNEGSAGYREIVEPLPSICRQRYVVMQNQYLIYDILGDTPRAAFWMVYADKGIIRVNEPTSTLFLEFPSFTVIEFRNADAAYFFNNEYMRDAVYGRIEHINDEEELEKWLYNNTEWSLDKDHQDHWRKAHMGNWQLDMKSYMSHNLRK